MKKKLFFILIACLLLFGVAHATDFQDMRIGGELQVDGVVLENDSGTTGQSLCFEGTTVDGNTTCFVITDPTADRTVTFGDASFSAGATNAHTADVTITGTTPTLTIGDGGAEDAGVIFNGVADYYFGADDTGGLAEDVVCVGVGGTIGATPTVCYNATQQMILENGETFDNVTDGTILFVADEALDFKMTAATGTTATLTIEADASEDANDTFTFTVSDSGGMTIASGGTSPVIFGEVADFTSTMTLANDEIFANDADDEVSVTSNDAATTFAVRGATGNFSSILEISADDASDAVDTWLFTVADGGAATLANDGTASLIIGEQVGSLKLSERYTTEGGANTLTLAECGLVFSDADGTPATTHTLPAVSGSAGCEFTFINASDSADDDTVTSPEGDNITCMIDVDDASMSVIDADVINFVDTADTVGDYVIIISDGVNWYARGVGEATGSITCTG